MLQCDASGKCTVVGMPQLWQSDTRLDGKLEDTHGGYGCYDTCIASLAIAALNDANGASPGGRTATFYAIGPTTDENGNPVSQELAKLSWIYKQADRHVAERTGPPKKDPATVTQPYYFTELLEDHGRIHQWGGSGRPSPLVYTDLSFASSPHGATFSNSPGSWSWPTNEYVRALIEAGFHVLLAYQRLTAEVVGSDEGRFDVTFMVCGAPHKVVVSGCQGGEWPLSVWDVGANRTREARLVNGLHGRGFGDPAATGGALRTLRYYQGPAQPEWNWRPTNFLEYKDDSNGPGDVVQFLDHVDALSLTWRPPRKVRTWNWAPGWSHLVPFEAEGKAALLAYNDQTGDVHLDLLHAAGAEGKWSHRWAPGWSCFLPFMHGGQPHLIAYNRAEGTVHFDRIRPDLQGPEILFEGRWGAGWTHLVPVHAGGSVHFIAYNADTGQIHIDAVRPDLRGSTTKWEGQWSPGWRTLASFSQNSVLDLIASNETGEVHFDRVHDHLQGSQTFASYNTAQSLFAEVPGHGVPNFVAYNAGTGTLEFGRVTGSSVPYDSYGGGSGQPGATHLLAFRGKQWSYALLYDRKSGTAVLYEVEPI